MCCLLPIASRGQVVGIVKDASDGTPLSQAYVIGLHNSRQVTYSFTKEDGRFSLSGDTAIDEVRVSLMGYEPVSKKINPPVEQIEIRLREATYSLDASSRKASVIKEKGDTSIYYAQNFRDGMEKNLGDLLEKLPGITVTSSGGVLHNGQYINKFYVEGMDLMGNRYGVVTENLNPDDIASVELYRHHQPVKMLRGIQGSDRSAINIILKEGVKNTWVGSGDAVLGAPPFPLFEARAMLSRFGKKNQSLILVKGNNLGNDLDKEIREQSYFGKSGVIQITADADADFSTSLSPHKSVLSLPREYWYDNLSGLFSANHITKVGKDAQIRYRTLVAAEKYDESSSSQESVNLPDGTTIRIDEEQSLTDTKYHYSAMADYTKNASGVFLNNEFSLSGQYREQSSEFLQENPAGQHYRLPSLKIEDSFRASLKTRSSRILNFSSTNKFISNSHRASYSIGEDGFTEDYLLKRFTSDNSVSATIRIARHSVSVSGHLSLDYSGLNSDFSAFSLRPGISISDQLYLGKANIRLSLIAKENYTYALSHHYFYPQIEPFLKVEYPLTGNLTLEADSRYSQSYSQDISLYPGFIANNYRTRSLGDSLGRVSRLNSAVALRYSDAVRMLFSSVRVYHTLTGSDRKTANEYTGGPIQQIHYIPVPSTRYDYGISGNIKKYFGIRTLVLDLSGGLSKTDADEFLQNKAIRYTGDNAWTSLDVSLVPAKWLSISAKGMFSYQQMSGDLAGKSRSLESSGAVLLTPVKRISVESQLYYRIDDVEGVSFNNRPLLKLTVRWQFPAFVLSAECRNLLDVDEYRRDYISTYRTISTSTSLRGRSFLIGIRMHL